MSEDGIFPRGALSACKNGSEKERDTQGWKPFQEVFPRRLLSKQELLLPRMRHAEGCALSMEIPRERWSLLAAMGDAPILVS